MDLRKTSTKDSILPEIFCRLLLIEPENRKAMQANSKCKCDKNEDGLCKLIIGWIDATYFWKTDPHFKRTYEHYARKSTEKWVQEAMLARI